MNLDLLLMRALYVFLALAALVFFFQRLLWKLRKRLGRTRLGFYPSGASLGNALHQLQIIAQPEVRYVIEEKLDESEADGEDDAGPEEPVRHLHRQAAKIRRGEPVSQLTAKLRPGG